MKPIFCFTILLLVLLSSAIKMRTTSRTKNYISKSYYTPTFLNTQIISFNYDNRYLIIDQSSSKPLFVPQNYQYNSINFKTASINKFQIIFPFGSTTKFLLRSIKDATNSQKYLRNLNGQLTTQELGQFDLLVIDTQPYEFSIEGNFQQTFSILSSGKYIGTDSQYNVFLTDNSAQKQSF